MQRKKITSKQLLKTTNKETNVFLSYRNQTVDRHHVLCMVAEVLKLELYLAKREKGDIFSKVNFTKAFESVITFYIYLFPNVFIGAAHAQGKSPLQCPTPCLKWSS
jgi:hypothetical protein